MANEHDGWPEEYHDPRERPHAETLRVTVEPFEETREGVIEATRSVEAGEETPAVVSFATVEELRSILTGRRLQLLRTLLDLDGAAESISALADDLERDYRPVHDDVTLLERHGLLFLVEDGRAKRPYLPYRRIHIDVELVAGTQGREP
jgi:predicted transcriptional regulator